MRCSLEGAKPSHSLNRYPSSPPEYQRVTVWIVAQRLEQRLNLQGRRFDSCLSIFFWGSNANWKKQAKGRSDSRQNASYGFEVFDSFLPHRSLTESIVDT